MEKLKLERFRKPKAFDKEENNNLSDRETEDLFKIAFRNYVDLISIADSKAGLMIQVNSILASVVIAFSIRHVNNAPPYIIPISITLITALITVFYSVLASKPQENSSSNKEWDNQQSFFFGSFDRIDYSFRYTLWQDYERTMSTVFNGDRNEIFSQITKETFQVRKVLSRKFAFLAVAYKVFMVGLTLSALSFIMITILD